MFEPITSLSDLAPVFPELLLALGALALLMIGVFTKQENTMRIFGITIGLLIATLAVILLRSSYGTLFGGGFIYDPFAAFMKVLILIGGASALIMSVSSAVPNKLDKFEFPVLIVLASLGMLVMVSANDLMTLYIGLELQSLSLYVLAAMNRDESKSTEAGLKYFVLGALSSGMLLYGASLIYGFTGHTRLDLIAEAILLSQEKIGLIFGLVFLLAGVAFKISAAPFHMWTPDVYEGAPTPVTAFFAAGPKVAAMAVFVRLVIESFGSITSDWQQIVVFLSLASMVLASFAAIGQSKLKRLIAYSSIGHVGFALVGLAAGHQVGVQGVAIYMVIYVAMTIGLFACILSLRTSGDYVEDIEQLSGLSQTRPFIAAIMTLLMFSLIGIPPLAGFFAKWQVFLAAIESGLYVLAVIGVLASAVSAFYYLRIIKTMYFDKPQLEFAGVPGELRILVASSGIFVLAYVIIAGPIAEFARIAAASLF